jgi:CheY-like chemotaxis protein
LGAQISNPAYIGRNVGQAFFVVQALCEKFHDFVLRSVLNLMFPARVPMVVPEIDRMTLASTPLKPEKADRKLDPSTRTILLVEDDSSVRDLVTRLLTLHGYRVLVAENGRAALPIWELHQQKIDLLLTDVVMPHGMNGQELASHCQAYRARLQVIYTSGYNVGGLSTDNGRLRNNIHFVQKPYRPEQLLEAVRMALSENSKT